MILRGARCAMSTAGPIEQMKRLAARYLGRVPYEQALRLQEETRSKRVRGEICDTLLLLEHESVFTMGRRDSRTHLLRDEASLGAPLLRCNRGGELTYHGPGQLVGYFHARLSEMNGNPTKRQGIGVKDLVFGLEEAIILLLRERYGLAPWRDLRHRGVWLGENKSLEGLAETGLGGQETAPSKMTSGAQNTGKIASKICAKIAAKICAMGISIQQGVSMHGFALNVCTDLRFFEQIVPCGIENRGVTSLEAELKRNFGKSHRVPSVKNIANELLVYFCTVFGYAPVTLQGMAREMPSLRANFKANRI